MSLEEAWAELHDASATLRWFVGHPAYEERRGDVPWSQYAFDPTEKPKVGQRSREWTAVGQTEVECVREMARCLREFGEGRMRK